MGLDRSNSEEICRGIVSTSPDAIFVVDRKSGKILDVNDAVQKLLGCTKDEIVGTIAGSRVVPSQKNAFKREFEKHISGGKFSGEYELVRKDGSIVSVDVKGSAIGDYLFAFVRDITERKRGEDELKALKDFNEQIVETSPVGIHVVDKNLVVKSWNSYLEEYTTIKKEDIIGKNLFEVIPGLLKDEWDKEYKKVMKSGMPFEKSGYRYVRSSGPKKGEVLYQNTKLVPLKQNGEIVGAVTILEDVTERYRTEEASRQSEEKYRRLVLQTKDAIFVGKADGSISYASPSCEAIFGYSPEEFMSDPAIASKIVHPDYLAQFYKFWEEYAKTKRFPKNPMEWGWIRKDKQTVYTENTFTDILDGQGEVIGFQTVARDITVRKRAEQALRESEERAKAQFKGVPVPTYTWQKAGNDFKLVDYNDAAHAITKGGIVNYVGKYAREMYSHMPEIPDDLARCFDEKKPIKREMPYRYLSTGETKYLAVTYGFVPPDLVLVHTEDITERKRGEEEISALLDISQNISATLNLETLLDVAVKKTVEATRVDRVSVVLVDENGRAHVPAAYTMIGERPGVGNVFNLADFPRMNEAVQKKKTVHVPDALDPKMQSPIEIALAKKLDIRSGVHVPLIARDNVLGLLNLAAVGRERKFTKRDLEFYKTIANQLSATIANARLYEVTKQAEEELLKHRDHLEELVKERAAELSRANEQLQKEMTERSRADEEIRYFKELNESIIEGVPIAIMVMDRDFIVKTWNRYCEDYVNVKKEDILNKQFFEVIPSLQKLGWDKVNRKVMDTGAPFEVKDYRIVRTFGPHKGEVWYQNVRIVPLKQNEKIIGSITLIEDVTERKKAELALRESEERFRMLTEGALVGVYIVQEGKFRYVNPSLAQTFGYRPEELIDKLGPLDLTHSDDRALVTEQIRRRLEGELEEVRYTFRGLRRDGSIVHCEVLSRRIEYKGGPAIIGTVLDITERKKAEDELRKRLLKFRLDDGKLYLMKEPKPILSFEAFSELLGIGYKGVVISRIPYADFKKIGEGNFMFLWLAEKGGDKSLHPEYGEIELEIEKLPLRSVILVEGLDYLAFKNGFRRTLAFVQRLREIAYTSGHIVILCVDPSAMGKQEIRLLEKEAAEVESLLKKLPADLHEILGYVYRHNMMGVKPSYSEVGMEIGVSKPTVRKRIKRLLSDGYMVVTKKGMYKVLELTEKGKIFFSK